MIEAAPPTLPPGLPPSLPPVIGGKYRPVRLIARGGMGAVYEVVHANTGARLALKLMLARSLLAPKLVERFRKEARIQSSVESEHVVRVVDADVAPEIDGAPFLVMELLEGRDFEGICAERRPAPAEVVDWLRQAGQALDKAHKQGIVHRDLKPENLFLAAREDLPSIVKILDFGVAKLIVEGDDGSTVTGQILGTPRYMAPEQAMGDKRVSSAADRFALGLIAFRLLSGRHYFEGDSWVTLLRTVTRGPGARPSELGCEHGAAFDDWFARACALDPARRFASCAEQIEELARALVGVSPRPRPSLRARGRALAVAALVSACGLGAVLWTAERGRTRAARVGQGEPRAGQASAAAAVAASVAAAPATTSATATVAEEAARVVPSSSPPIVRARPPAAIAGDVDAPRSARAEADDPAARRRARVAKSRPATPTPRPPATQDRIKGQVKDQVKDRIWEEP